MKEFQSTTGGRHVYNTDFKNMQELALAMQEMFRACGGNFVISGCDVTVDTDISVSEGYVYIDGKIRKTASATKLSASDLYIVSATRSGDTIPYADGNNSTQYTEYYAETKNVTAPNVACIAYDSTSQSFPNLATVYFNYYAVCKKAGNQSLDNLTVQQSLTASKTLAALQGVQLDNTGTSISKTDNSIALKIGDITFAFDSTGTISVKNGDDTLFSFSNSTGTGTITYENVTVTQELRANKFYLGDVDIESKLVPLGVIQMWAGEVTSIPDGYRLCNGDTLSKTDYKLLYNVIGDVFNTAFDCNGNKYSSPSSNAFRLPDLRGRFIVGYHPNDNEYSYTAAAGGEKAHTLTEAEIPSHTHPMDDYYFTEHSNVTGYYGKQKKLDNGYAGCAGNDTDNNAIWYVTHPTQAVGGSNAHENRPPYYVLAYIMRVK